MPIPGVIALTPKEPHPADKVDTISRIPGNSFTGWDTVARRHPGTVGPADGPPIRDNALDGVDKLAPQRTKTPQATIFFEDR